MKEKIKFIKNNFFDKDKTALFIIKNKRFINIK